MILWCLCGLIGAGYVWYRTSPDELTLGHLFALIILVAGGPFTFCAIAMISFMNWFLFAPPIVLWRRKP